MYFKLEDIIQTTVQSFAFINEQNNNTLKIDLDSEIPEVLCGDKTKIAQVLMNLVSNASKFTQDGIITIKAQCLEKLKDKVALKFYIEDTGIGIPEEQQSKIFDEFAQISNSSNYEGTGLGLPIVNKILGLLESKLHFESTYGKGTLFFFELQLEMGTVNNLEVSNYGIYDKKLENKKILIVDDNKINQIVTQKVLEQYGIVHETVNNGLQALEQVQEATYDLILMDINMPVMNGLESSKAIRELNINTPIIALTAVNSENPETEFIPYGINNAIIKPYQTEKLIELIRKYIDY